MTTKLKEGVRDWSMTRDEVGYREYSLTVLVMSDVDDGPLAVMDTPGLYRPGAPWDLEGNIDPWVWCRPNLRIKQLTTNEPGKLWEVTQTFSNRPPQGPASRDPDQPPEDPLDEPYTISGGTESYTVEATEDRFGFPIKSSSHEPLLGPQVEFDKSRGTVKVTQNVPDLELDVMAALVDCVNDAPLWGMAERCVRFKSYSWERKFYQQSELYYVRNLEFLIDGNTFDRNLVDVGSKVLHGRWNGDAWQLLTIDGAAPNPNNPAHFDRYKDRNGENTRVVLDGFGLPASVFTRAPTFPPSKYVCILQATNKPTSNATYWVKLTSGQSPTPVWADDEQYGSGELVGVVDVGLFLSKTANKGKSPEDFPDVWVQMPTDVTEQGRWTADQPYVPGDIVVQVLNAAGTVNPHLAGYRHVEKYTSANLLLLRIPTTF